MVTFQGHLKFKKLKWNLPPIVLYVLCIPKTIILLLNEYIPNQNKIIMFLVFLFFSFFPNIFAKMPFGHECLGVEKRF